MSLYMKFVHTFSELTLRCGNIEASIHPSPLPIDSCNLHCVRHQSRDISGQNIRTIDIYHLDAPIPLYQYRVACDVAITVDTRHPPPLHSETVWSDRGRGKTSRWSCGSWGRGEWHAATHYTHDVNTCMSSYSSNIYLYTFQNILESVTVLYKLSSV